MRHLPTLLLTGLLASAAFTAAAQTTPAAPAKPGGAFAQWDKNRDGMISREEAQGSPGLSKNFDAADVNRDGFLTPMELRAAQEKRKADAFRALDSDGDGRISRAEAAAKKGFARSFDAIDTNKDGTITPGELQAYKTAQHQARLAKPQS